MEVVPATRKPREKSREKKTPVRSKKGNEGTPHGSETAKTSQNPDRGPAAPLTSRDGASRVPIGSENILTGVFCGHVHAFGDGDTRARATTERV